MESIVSKKSVLEIVNDSIVELYQRDYPELYASIEALVNKGESYKTFQAFLKRKFAADYNTSMTVSASLTIFKHLKKLKLDGNSK